MRCDVCTFAKHSRYQHGKVKRLTSIIILRVDDLLIAADEQDLSLFQTAIAQYRTGVLTTVSIAESITYLGLEICIDAKGRFGMQQTDYISKLNLARIGDVIRNNTFAISDERWATLTKQILGSLIRANQTRLGGCAISTNLSTSAVATVGIVHLALDFIRLYNRSIKKMQESPHIIWYDKWPGDELVESTHILTKSTLLVFAGARYNNLGNSCSTQRMVVIVGKGGKQGDSVESKGNLLFFPGAKMKRIVRSSLACEAVATCQGIDQNIWHQYYLFEISTAQFHKDFCTPMGQLPLLNPYLFGRDRANLPMGQSSQEQSSTMQEPTVHLMGKYSGQVYPVITQWLQDRQSAWGNVIGPNLHQVKCVVLSDCADAYCDVENISAPSKEKTTRSALAYIRDNLSLAMLSYVEAIFNLSDFGGQIERELGYLGPVPGERKIRSKILRTKEGERSARAPRWESVDEV